LLQWWENVRPSIPPHLQHSPPRTSARNDQLAKLIGENDFNSLFHQGEKESMYLADIAHRVILVVLFDNRTTLGLVRLKMRQTVAELSLLFVHIFSRGATPSSTPHLLAGADDEIDKLFQ